MTFANTLNSKISYRLGYTLASLLLVSMAAVVPDTYLYAKCPEDHFNGELCDNIESKAILLLIYIFVVSSFYIVQGSDPGYISRQESVVVGDSGTYLEYPHDVADEVAWNSLEMMESNHSMPAQSNECLEHPDASLGKITQSSTEFLDSEMRSSCEAKWHCSSMIESKQNQVVQNNEYLEYQHEYLDEIKWNTSSMIDPTRHSSLKNIFDQEKESLLPSNLNPLLAPAPIQDKDSRDLQSVVHTYLPGGLDTSLRNVQKANRNANNRTTRQPPKKVAWRRRDSAARSENTNAKTNNGSTGDDGRYEGHCKYCEMSVPLRSHHCNACQRCVATFDHHCPVIGTCIGERNHCRFYTFILINFLGVWLLSHIVDSAFSLSKAAMASAVAVREAGGVFTPPPPVDLELAYISSAFLGVTWWYIILLLLYQTWLACTSSTGYECIKSGNSSSFSRAHSRSDDSDTCESPYGGKHVLENFLTFCCFRDGVFSVLRNVPWEPKIWKKPSPRPNIEDTEVCDNFCRNKYYSCC